MVAAVGVLRLAFREVIHGPTLDPTPDSLSLVRSLPASEGWSATLADPARAYADSLGTHSVIVLWRGRVAAEWGDTAHRLDLGSVRDPLLGALFGIAEARGLVNLDSTLGELGIDERGRALSAVERDARIIDLLTSRSGVYHAAIRDVAGPYPAPGTHPPGETFVYNTWGLNAAGTVFERLTGLAVGRAFEEWIARPLGMEDFRAGDITYVSGPESAFPSWGVRMSARDLARFGQLIVQRGRWDGDQILPEAWIDRSMSAISDAGDEIGYGVTWWTMPNGWVMATGSGGQKLTLHLSDQVVVVHRVDTGLGFSRAIWRLWGEEVDNSEFAELRHRILAAGPSLSSRQE